MADMTLEEGATYVNGHGEIRGPMRKVPEPYGQDTWLDQHGGLYNPDGRQWNHTEDSAGNLVIKLRTSGVHDERWPDTETQDIADMSIEEMLCNIEDTPEYFSPTELRLAAEVRRLRRDCAEAYQCAGYMVGDERAIPSNDDLYRLLDNLSAAASGLPRPHDDLLPWPNAPCSQRAPAPWIQVSDKLPGDDGRVLAVYRPRHRQHMRAKLRIIEARYSNGAWRFLSKKFKTNKSDSVTHWMPLPAPPKEEA